MLIQLTKSPDLVCGQETWLRPCELYKLSNFINFLTASQYPAWMVEMLRVMK